jgi:hypothetical protein
MPVAPSPVAANACPTCGGDPSIAADLRLRDAARQRAEAKTMLREPLRQIAQTNQFFRGLGFLLGGIVAIGLGLSLLFSPAWRANPNQLTTQEIVPGVGAIVSGVVMCLLAVMWLRRR